MPRTSGAKDAIKAFVESGAPGATLDISAQSLKHAAQELYTAKGKNCPVIVKSVGGQSLLINREKYNVNGNS